MGSSPGDTPAAVNTLTWSCFSAAGHHLGVKLVRALSKFKSKPFCKQEDVDKSLGFIFQVLQWRKCLLFKAAFLLVSRCTPLLVLTFSLLSITSWMGEGDGSALGPLCSVLGHRGSHAEGLCVAAGIRRLSLPSLWGGKCSR